MSFTDANASKLVELGKKYLELGNFMMVMAFCIVFLAFLFIWMWTETKYEHAIRTIACIAEDKMLSDKELALYWHYSKKTFYEKWREKLE